MSSSTATLAPRVVVAQEGPSYRVVADFVTFKATAEQTGGAYGLFEGLSMPGMGTPPHYERYNVHVAMPAGVSSLALFQTARPGSYLFYCAPHYDKATGTGMYGTLIVEP